MCSSDLDPEEKFLCLRERLVDQFGEFSEHPQDHDRPWKYADVTFRNGVIVFCVRAKNSREARTFLRQLKKDVTEQWRQKNVLIIETESAPEGGLAGERI